MGIDLNIMFNTPLKGSLQHSLHPSLHVLELESASFEITIFSCLIALPRYLLQDQSCKQLLLFRINQIKVKAICYEGRYIAEVAVALLIMVFLKLIFLSFVLFSTS